MSSKLGALDKGVCDKEFQALKACSEATLRRQRGGVVDAGLGNK